MKKTLAILLCITNLSLYAQNLEEQIYVAAETFIANPNHTSLLLLSQKEAKFKNQVNTKDEQLALVFLQCHKGYYLDQNSRLKEALTSYEDAFKRFENHHLSKVSDFDIVESCLMPLGNLYTKTGNYTSAESIIKQYIAIAETQGNRKQKISGVINLAQLYYTIGKYDTAIKLTSDYVNNTSIHQNQLQKLISINVESQIALGKTEGYNNVPIPLDDEKEYKIALQNQDYETALKAFERVKAKRFSSKQLPKRYLAKLLAEEAQLYILLNNNDKASESLDGALNLLVPDFEPDNLPNTQDLYAENTFLDIFDLYAEIQPDATSALEYYDLSFYVSGLLRDNWTSQEAKIINQTNNRNRSEKCIDLLYQAYKNTNDESYLLSALQYAENSRTSTLKEMYQKKIRLQKYPEDTLLVKEYNLLRQQEHLTSLLVQEQLGSNKATVINQLGKQLSEISLQIKSLKATISIHYPETEPGFSLTELRTKLATDATVLVSYFYGKHTIYQFVVSNSDIAINAIALNAKAKQQITDFIQLFNEASTITNAIKNYTSKAYSLYKYLNFDAVANQKAIILIPDGLLNFVPFETLLAQETNTTSFAKMPFVVHYQNVTYNSSIHSYLSNVAPMENNQLLGVFPVFENTEKALTYSADEAKAIEKEMDSKMLMGTSATKENFINLSAKYGTLHLSTHASSGGFTMPASINFYNNTMVLNDLYSMNLNTNLVVLSACETGIGKLFKGEGAMSIARGFQYAGVKNVLFSLWQINDLSTSKLMASFYKNYGKTHSAHYSNRQSKLDYLLDEDISNAKKSPYYWGAFVYYGEIMPPKTSAPKYYIILGIFFVLIIVPLLFKFMRSHGKNVTGISSR